MEKKHHFQGFRKFSIKTRLVIALLLISIIPLAGISGYSFHIFSVALREKLSASISQTLSMINLNMVSEIEKYQYLCGSICISEEIKDGLLNKDMSDIEKNQAINEIQHMVRTKIIYPAQAKNITVYDTDGNIFYDLGYDGFYQDDVDMLLDRLRLENQDVWAYVHTYRDRDILVLGRRIYEQYSESRVIGYTLISIDEKIFSKTVLEPVGLADSSNIMYMNMDGTVLSSWDRNIALGEKVDSEFLKNIQHRFLQHPQRWRRTAGHLYFQQKAQPAFCVHHALSLYQFRSLYHASPNPDRGSDPGPHVHRDRRNGISGNHLPDQKHAGFL